MQRWQLAARRYRQIVPQPVLQWSDFPFREIEIWLRRDVCPVVEQYSKRPAFREAATRSLRAFAAGAQGPERALLDGLEDAFKNYLRELSTLVGKERIRRKLIELYPPRMQVVSESVIIGASKPTRSEVVAEPVDLLSIEINQIQAMAEQPLLQLVKIEDYLQPVQEFVKTPDGQFIQRGEFIVSVTPELPPVGDFVVACLLRRIDTMDDAIERVCQKALVAARRSGQRYDALAKRLVHARSDYRAKRRALEVAFQTGPEQALSDSCVILTQVYAALHLAPDVTWLGLPAQLIEYGATAIRARFTQYRNAEMFDRIAAALEDLPRLYEASSTDQPAKDEAIATGGLVIAKDPPAVYWETAIVEAKWRGNSWKLLNALAQSALRHSFVEANDVFPDSLGSTAMSTNIDRLKKLLPTSLRRHIVPGELPRTYRLNLEPQRIHIFG